MKVRKKPVVVEADKWLRNGDHPKDESTWIFKKEKKFLSEGKVVRRFRHPKVSGARTCDHCTMEYDAHGWIDTLEGGHVVCPGDFIITGVKNEYYPCKPDIFEMTYEKI